MGAGKPHILVLGDDDCWPWIGARSSHGYGMRKVDGRTQMVHKIAYEECVGPIPDGMQIDHICRNRACCNPAHLRLATNKQNGENVGLPANNTSGYRGVDWHKQRRKWRATVRHNGKQLHLGCFDDVHEAGEVARQARLRLFTHNEEDKP